SQVVLGADCTCERIAGRAREAAGGTDRHRDTEGGQPPRHSRTRHTRRGRRERRRPVREGALARRLRGIAPRFAHYTEQLLCPVVMRLRLTIPEGPGGPRAAHDARVTVEIVLPEAEGRPAVEDR